jgi:hypothetical protein
LVRLVTARAFYPQSALCAALALAVVAACVGCGYFGPAVSLVYPDPAALLDAPIEVTTPIAARFPEYRPMQPMPNFVSTFHPTRYGLVDGASGGPYLNATSLKVFETETQARVELETVCRTYARQCGERQLRRPAASGGEACVAPFWRERGSLRELWAFEPFQTGLAVRRGRLVVEIHGTALDQTPEEAVGRVTTIARDVAEKLATGH